MSSPTPTHNPYLTTTPTNPGSGRNSSPSALAAKDYEIKRLRQRVSLLSNEHEYNDELLIQSKNRADELQTKLDGATKDNVKLKTQIANLTTDYLEQQEELVKLKLQLTDITTKHELQKQISSRSAEDHHILSAQNSHLENQLTKLTKTNTALDLELKTLKTEISGLVENEQALGMKLDSLQLQKQELEAKVKELEGILDDSKCSASAGQKSSSTKRYSSGFLNTSDFDTTADFNNFFQTNCLASGVIDLQLADAKERIQILEAELQDQKSIATEFQHNYGLSKERISILEQDVVTGTEQLNDIQLKKQCLEEELKKSQEKTSALEQEIVKVIETLNVIQLKNQCLEEELKKSQEKKSALEEEIVKGTTKLNDIQLKNKSLEEELQKSLEKTSALENEIVIKTAQLKNIELKNLSLEAELKQFQDRVSTLDEEIVKGTEKVNDIQLKNQSLEEELQKSQEKTCALEAELVKRGYQLDQIQLTNQSLLAELKRFQDRVSTLDEEIVKGTEKVNDIQLKNQSLEEELQKSLEKTSALENEIAIKTAQLKNIELKNQSLEEELQKYLEKTSALENEIETKTAQLNQIKLKNQSVEEELQNCQEKTCALEVELVKRGYQLDQIKLTNQSLEIVLAQSQERIGALEQDLVTEIDQFTEVQIKNQSLEKELGNLRTSLDSHEKHNKTLSLLVENLQEKLKTDKASIQTRYSQRFEEMKKELLAKLAKQAEEDSDKFKEQIVKAREEIEKLRRGNALIEASKIEISNKVFGLQQSLKEEKTQKERYKELYNALVDRQSLQIGSMTSSTTIVQPTQHATQFHGGSSQFLNRASSSSSFLTPAHRLKSSSTTSIDSNTSRGSNSSRTKVVPDGTGSMFQCADEDDAASGFANADINLQHLLSCTGTRMSHDNQAPAPNPIESPSKRIAEIQRRNTLLRPHMRSVYPAEYQFFDEAKADERKLRAPALGSPSKFGKSKSGPTLQRNKENGF